MLFIVIGPFKIVEGMSDGRVYVFIRIYMYLPLCRSRLLRLSLKILLHYLVASIWFMHSNFPEGLDILNKTC